MIDPVTDRRPPVSPQLAIRVAALGVVAFVLFAIIFFRLWYLQVLSGDQYLAQAQTNRVRVQKLPASRGLIVDRNGNTLVENTAAVVVRVSPEALPDSEKTAAAKYGDAVIARAKRPAKSQGPKIAIPPVPPDLHARFALLAKTLSMRESTIQERVITALFQAGYAPITIKTNVPAAVTGFIAERQEQFPGITTPNVFLRSYPNKDLAAQIFGTTNEISPSQLKDPFYKRKKIALGTVIGQSGIEAAYDDFLRGTDGRQRLLVDAQGNPRGTGTRVEPTPGRSVQLTLDLKVQKAAQAAYLERAGSLDGAFVAMDPTTGGVLAMGSFPTYDPTLLARPISTKKYDETFKPKSSTGGPLFNRVTQSQYATGSVFKIVTALAALKAGVITTTSTYDDGGCIVFGGDKRKACNSGGGKGYGTIDLAQALKFSSDTFFYELGLKLDPKPNQPLQKMARALGFGSKTGIDLGGEIDGTVPDQAWRQRINDYEIACRKKNNVSLDVSAAVAALKGCGTYEIGRFNLGDEVNLAVGQGDLQADPLQLAVAYAALANGGRVVRPHLGASVLDDKGTTIQPIPRKPSRKVDIPSAYRDAIMRGLHMSASEAGGTSADVFSKWNQSRFPIYGKTGTAENFAQGQDQSWYVAYSFDGKPDHKPIVVAVTAEKGGFGADTAAPIACKILKTYFGAGSNVAATCSPGQSETR